MRYRAVDRLQLADHAIEPGETVDYPGIPGLGLAPLDDDAVAAKVSAVTAWLARPTPAGVINWGRHSNTLRCARSLGFQGGTFAESEAFITSWLATPAVVGAIAPLPSIS